MFKVLIFQAFLAIMLLNKLISSQPISQEEVEEHLNNRLKHTLKRIEILKKTSDLKFPTELKNLIEQFKYSLTNGSIKEKTDLLETHTQLQDFAEFLAMEFDKQYINEDILIESWYLNEILPHLTKGLYDETIVVLKNLQDAFRSADLDDKFNKFSDIGESLSEQFLDYFYGENIPLPLLNAQLKYYYEYITYLLQVHEQVGEDYQQKLRDLSPQIVVAMTSDDLLVKRNILKFFDDITTKFGRFLDEHFMDFQLYKFEELQLEGKPK